jgi:arsenate reductase
VTTTVYGILNCDTTRKARHWLDERGVDYVFHDYKTRGIDRKRLGAWAAKVGWELLLNRAGTTFRGLSDADRRDIDRNKAIVLMQARPTLIKRPVIEVGDRLIVGFRLPDYEKEWPPGKAKRRPVGGPGRRLGQD